MPSRAHLPLPVGKQVQFVHGRDALKRLSRGLQNHEAPDKTIQEAQGIILSQVPVMKGAIPGDQGEEVTDGHSPSCKGPSQLLLEGLMQPVAL